VVAVVVVVVIVVLVLHEAPQTSFLLYSTDLVLFRASEHQMDLSASSARRTPAKSVDREYLNRDPQSEPFALASLM